MYWSQIMKCICLKLQNVFVSSQIAMGFSRRGRDRRRTEVSIKPPAGQSVASRQSVGRRQAARWWVHTSRQSEKSFEKTQWRIKPSAKGKPQSPGWWLHFEMRDGASWEFWNLKKEKTLQKIRIQGDVCHLTTFQNKEWSLKTWSQICDCKMAGVNPNLILEAEEVSLGADGPSLSSPSATGTNWDTEELMLVDSVDYSSQNVAVLSILLALALIANLSAFPVILFRRTRLKDKISYSIQSYSNFSTDLETVSLPVSSSVSLSPTFSPSLAGSLGGSY